MAKRLPWNWTVGWSYKGKVVYRYYGDGPHISFLVEGGWGKPLCLGYVHRDWLLGWSGTRYPRPNVEELMSESEYFDTRRQAMAFVQREPVEIY